MISLEQFEEFGRPRTERIFRKFDEVFIHMHALSLSLIHILRRLWAYRRTRTA